MEVKIYNLDISGFNTLLIPMSKTDIISVGMLLECKQRASEADLTRALNEHPIQKKIQQLLVLNGRKNRRYFSLLILFHYLLLNFRSVPK